MATSAGLEPATCRLDRFYDGFQTGERLTNVFIGRYRALEQTNHLGNRHHGCVWVAG